MSTPYLSWCWLPLLLAATLPSYASAASAASAEAECAACHPAETRAWQRSDHARAMARATPATVLADFKESAVQDGDWQADFSAADGYRMRLQHRSESGSTEYRATHTFGHQPLQQYLTPTHRGRWQVLPLAWDTRSITQGGQRWFGMHPGEPIGVADRLHWQQPLANWNGMCADCHVTGLRRGYDAGADRFNTRWDTLGVSCAACHQLPEDHGAEPASQAASQPGMDVCFACHSLREPLTDGIDPGTAFLDQFMPQWPAPPHYFVDGQIREEVYVWGSFLQSRMHAEGVVCGDCHDPHSQALKRTGNALCATCHAPQDYDVPAHHRHPAGSDGAQCVNCHMPERTYMVVDPRRDHSFKRPRPGTAQPDPCSQCHTDRTPEWAARQLAAWQRAPAPLSDHEQWLQAGLRGAALPPRALTRVLADAELPAVRRAAVLTSQARLPGNAVAALAMDTWTMLLRSEALLQLAAVSAADTLPAGQRIDLVAPQLSHPLRAVRVASASTLTGVPLPAAARQAFAAASGELDQARAVNAWRGEGRLNQGLLAERRGDLQGAITAYQAATRIDPYFAPAYVNLANAYRQRGELRAEREALDLAQERLPRDPSVAYAAALHAVRGKRHAEALADVTRFLAQQPDQPQIAFLCLLLLAQNAGPDAALDWLLTRPALLEDDAIVRAGLDYARQSGRQDALQRLRSAAERLAAGGAP